ncbi:MAG: helix-turn-helix domain-containing protein [Streptosporangiaceae bacterium]
MGASQPAGATAGPRRSVASRVVNEHVTGRPAAGLRQLISGYAGYRQAGGEPAVHRGLPSPFLTVIFTLDEPLNIAAHPDPAQPGGRYDTLVGGLHTTPALIRHDGRQSGIQIAMSPLGARPLLGVPAGELASLDLHGTEVLGPLATRVRQQLAECGTWAGRFEILNGLLLARAQASGPRTRAGISREVGHAWRELLRSGGRIGVARLAADAGWSDRHLRAQFRQEIGLRPKAAARVIRFDQVPRRLLHTARAGRVPDLAALAAECGYYDQAHLDREFAALAGCTPTTWLAQEFRNVQAAAEYPVAG